MNKLSRRFLLKGALLGGAAYMSFDQLFGYSRLSGQDANDDAQLILNLAATAETFAATHYYTVLTEGDVALAPAEVEMVKGFLDAEMQHLDYLTAAGGVALVNEFYFPTDVFNDRQQFADITEMAETTFVAAYLAATRRLAELGQPLLAGTAAQVAAIEQEHLALVRGIGGRRPNNLAFARALFFNASEAEPALQPFLEGGPNYDGPRPFPGVDAIRDLIQDEGVISVATFTDAVTPTVETATVEATAEATTAPAATCTITPAHRRNLNLRSGPGLNFSIIDRLNPGNTLDVDLQARDSSGYTWLRVTNTNRWVRSDLVDTMGDCDNLPIMSA